MTRRGSAPASACCTFVDASATCDRCVFGDVGVDVDAVAQFAVELNDKGHPVGLQIGGVRHRPRLQVHVLGVPGS